MTNNILSSLREIRKAKRISQEAVAVSLGMTGNCGPAISRLESGVQNPTISTVTNWAEALGYELVLRPKA